MNQIDEDHAYRLFQRLRQVDKEDIISRIANGGIPCGYIEP